MTQSNIPEFSVSELAFSLKKTVEEGYSRIRVRGELSKVKIHTSGHLYSDIKDAESVLNIICWRGTLGRLSLVPEEGMEVICTGKITTYPARSNYQMIVEHMELAGEGALLKMLEDRRKRLSNEGLFDEAHKKRLPFLPRVIGVVTSPTGAVIRDILHRLEDRFPCHVLVWPVKVQGEGAALEISNAIYGFSNLPKNGPTPRPDLVIVARGGGSLEDLMPFNEESVVRAAFSCSIPLISAVGHETDTTLIDFVADQRAPTPSAAAEMAVPERWLLLAQLDEYTHRARAAITRFLREQYQRVATLSARLGDPLRLLDLKTQTVDHLSDRLRHALIRNIEMNQQAVLRLGGRLVHPRQLIQNAKQALSFQNQSLQRMVPTLFEPHRRKIDHMGKLLEVLSFKNTLNRGFTVVRTEDGQIISQAAATRPQQLLHLHFADGSVKTKVEES